MQVAEPDFGRLPRPGNRVPCAAAIQRTRPRGLRDCPPGVLYSLGLKSYVYEKNNNNITDDDDDNTHTRHLWPHGLCAASLILLRSSCCVQL